MTSRQRTIHVSLFLVLTPLILLLIGVALEGRIGSAQDSALAPPAEDGR